jgi:transposase
MDAHSYSPQVEVLPVTDSGRRRRWTVEEKIRIVEESFARPRAVSATARRNGLARSLLGRWRSEYRAGLLGSDRQPAFAPVAVVADPAPTPPGTSGPQAQVEIVLTNGRRVVVAASIEPAALARLLPVVEGA